MPIYEYKCDGCQHTLEVIQKVADTPLRDCPACGTAGLKRLMSASGFQLKGTGWYATDFKHSGKKNKDEKGEKGEKGEKEEKGEKKTETPEGTPPKKAGGDGSGGGA